MAATGAQDCASCPNLKHCWRNHKGERLKPRRIVVNLLVCRLQRNISRDASTRLLLHILQPKLRQMAVWTARRARLAVADVLSDLQSLAVEHLLRYRQSQAVPPFVWLFNPRFGALRNWALQTTSRARLERDLFLSYGVVDDTEDTRDFFDRIHWLNKSATSYRITSAPHDQVCNPPELVDTALRERVARVAAALEDGTTFTPVEYRILRFCLTHALDASRALTTLHAHLARVLRIPRKDVSRLYGIARRKVLDVAGLRASYLRALGIRSRPARQTRNHALTADEVIAALELLRAPRATLLDIAWALGVTDVTLHNIRRRYGAMTPDEIRVALKP